MENGEDITRSPSGDAGGSANGSAQGDTNGEGKIGRILERARQERGLSLEEAERATKIRKRYLAGLEKDDYTVLPDAVYARGFLKTYANFLGLDGTQLSEEIRSRRKPRRERGISYRPPRSDFDKPILTPGGVGGARERRFPVAAVVTALVAIVVLAILIGVLYFVGRGVLAEAENGSPSSAGQPPRQENRELAVRDETPAREAGGAGSTARGDDARGGPVGSGAPLDALTVRVEVEEAPSWILIEADSEVVSEEVAQPGFIRIFEAKRRIGISTGNAGAVSVTVNGQDVGALGADGEVLSRNFTLKSAS